MEDLVTLPGIGRKTANVILGVAFGVPGFAVDTHVIRLANRLGLASTKDPAKIEALVTRMVPAEEWTGLSLRLILHGRRICVARRPLCEQCVLNDFCPSSLVKPRPVAIVQEEEDAADAADRPARHSSSPGLTK
jgi:endonuclease-3